VKKITLFCFTFLLLTASGVLSQRTDYTVDYDADFSKFKTYKWIPFKSVGPIDNLTDDQIKAALDAALAQKGLKKVDTDTADLFVDYQSRGGFTTAHPLIPGYNPPPSIYEGDLAINMYTPADHHLVWRGVASKALDPNANAEKRQRNLNKAVAKLLKNYPPK
jgi:Domain of unknown function (DUF4136)